MDNIVIDKPNLAPETVPVKEASVGLDAIAAKMAAMRNQVAATIPPGTGSTDEAKSEAPVAPEGVEQKAEEPESDTSFIEPEVAEPEAEYADSGDGEAEAQEDPVSSADTTQAEVIDFLEFAETHPNAKFKFMRNGKEIEIDAKKAASILGQGAAISEEARQLKVQRAEFEEYLSTKKAETDGLMLAMEFTVRPQLQKAYDEIIKVQQYQNVFRQQLGQTADPVQQAQIQANMQQNEQYLQRMAQTVNQLKPNLEQFYQLRSNQVREVLESNRQQFQDKELRNRAIYDEVRDKIAKGWQGAKNQLVPGVDNIDLVTSDEHILSLIRDGLKYRDRPKAKPAGGSIAALTTRKTTSSVPTGRQQDEVSSLREKARSGDTKAADNLLVAQLSAIRQARGTRR
jgi:ribosomal protein S16